MKNILYIFQLINIVMIIYYNKKMNMNNQIKYIISSEIIVMYCYRNIMKL